MNYFDLHCDTLTALFDKGETLKNSTCHVKGSSVSEFESYVQVSAVFSDSKKSDSECFERFSKVTDSFKEKNELKFISSFGEITENIENKKPSFILSVEDARLLSSDMGKLSQLLEAGVKLITPLWGGVTCIGGAFDTDEGLSPFGKKLIQKMIERGVICDISHASRKSAAYILDACKEARVAPVASHSNSFSVYPHPRNLTDGEAERIAELGGVIGISLAPQHLGNRNVTIRDVMRHIDRYRTVAGDSHIAFGCDFDGIDNTPKGLEDQSKMKELRKFMTDGVYSERFTEKLFFSNAFEFFKKIFK
ncbi:MAG: hypothetical protein E7660_01370 [Ruminococcaceae bacterium]|nr:hypothetical protein [Oscillospiraceae bacterium]